MEFTKLYYNTIRARIIHFTELFALKQKNASMVYRIYTNILEILDINIILQFVIICESKRSPESLLQLVVESLYFITC